jgi:hypothetical protein
MSINITSKTVLECKEWLNKLGAKNRITLSWIKAHANHPRNELADGLAKSGTTQGGIGPWPHQPASHFQNNLLTKINAHWQQKWVADPDFYKQSKFSIQNVTQNVTKLNKLLNNNTDRQFVGLLIQFITGHCNLRYHAKKSNPFVDPKCRLCLDAPETPIHLIRSCQALTIKRKEIFSQDSLCVNFDWTANQKGIFLGRLLALRGDP